HQPEQDGGSDRRHRGGRRVRRPTHPPAADAEEVHARPYAAGSVDPALLHWRGLLAMAAWREGGERRATGDGREPLRVVKADDRLHWGRGILVGFLCIFALVVIAFAAVLILTGTDWGRERVRRYAVTFVNGQIHGKATIGRISGNLLTGMIVH